MRLAIALAVAPAVLAHPTSLAHRHHARQECANPSDNASCMDLVWSCHNSGVNWGNPWSSRSCTAAATCAGVGNLLGFARCRGNNVPDANSLPNLDYNVYASIVGGCAWAPGGCPITPQNYIDFVYGQISSAWPPSADWVVSTWWNPIKDWAAFPDGRIPYMNFNDWLHWSTTISVPNNNNGGSGGGDNGGGNGGGGNGGGEVTNGMVTFFYQGGNAGACGDWHSDNDYVIALPAALYGDFGQKSSLCGRRMAITNTENGNRIEAVVADACPPCDWNHLDLSTGAFNALGDPNRGVLPVSYQFI